MPGIEVLRCFPATVGSPWGPPGTRLGTLVQELGRPVKDLKKVTSRSKAMAACYPGHGARYVKHVDNDENHPLCRTRLLTALILGLLIHMFYFFPRASERRVLPIVGVCISSSHLHIFSSSHLLIFTSAHLHICSSSHLLIFTFSHHLHIFTSSHLHIFSSSHLLIFTSSHLLIFAAHLHIFTSAHLHICSSSHLLILTSSHPHIFTSSHLTSSLLALLPSCPLLLFYFSLEGGSRGSANETARNATLWHETRFDRQKLR